MSNVTSWCMNTARNATDISQIVNFISSLQPVNKLQQTCHFHQVATSLLKSASHLQICYKLQSTCYKSVDLQQTCRQQAACRKPCERILISAC